MAERSEFFHAYEVFFFFFPLNGFFSCFIYFLFSLSPPLILGRPGELKCATTALRVLVYTGSGTRFWTCSDPGVSPLEIWSQIQGVCEISKEAVSKLHRVFTFLIGAT